MHEPDVERGARDLPGVVSLDDDLFACVEETGGLDVQFVVVGGQSGEERGDPGGTVEGAAGGQLVGRVPLRVLGEDRENGRDVTAVKRRVSTSCNVDQSSSLSAMVSNAASDVGSSGALSSASR